METSLKTGFAQIFSCCPKNLSCPKLGGAAALLAPPGPYAYEYSIAWIPVWGDLHLSVGSFSRTPASNRASLENHLKESSKEV